MSHIYYPKENGEWFLYSTITDSFLLDGVEREMIFRFKLNREKERLEKQLDKIEEEGSDYYLNYDSDYEVLKEDG